MTNNSVQSEQKNDCRFKVRLSLYDDPDGRPAMTDYVVNMTTGGMFIETFDLLPVDTVLKVELMVPGREAPLSGQARVAWTNGPSTLKKESLPQGMGLQFLAPLRQ